MLDKRSEAVLQDIVRRMSRSLLLYVCESFPWATPEEQGALAELQTLNTEEREAVARLVRFLQRQRAPAPLPGAYPTSFTSMNYVSLDYVLPLVARAERATLAVLERYTNEIPSAEAKAEIERLVQTVQGHLKQLEALVPAQPAAATTH